MCGIIAVLRRPSARPAPAPAEVLLGLERALATLQAAVGGPAADGAAAGPGHSPDLAGLRRAAGEIAAVDERLRGVAGIEGLRALLADSRRTATFQGLLDQLDAPIVGLEQGLDRGEVVLAGPELEAVNAALVALKDATWAIRHDRLRAARAVLDLLGESGSRAALEAFTSVQTALSSLDRLEVRGRDSAGLHLLVTGHGLDLDGTELRTLIGARQGDPLFTSMAVRTPRGHLSFVYKAAAEIGELGDNTAALRAAIRGDQLLHRALEADTARCTVLGHTRWASVGVISQPNAHPLNSDEAGGSAGEAPYVVAALNGDVDNYLDLRTSEALRIPAEVTTDAKVIPTLVSRRMAEGLRLEDAFRATVARFEGSVAIGASTADAPDQLLFALRGSGQSLNIGLAEDAFIVASEAYGLVEETTRYLRMDGESTRGQVVVLDRDAAGTLEGIHRFGYDGAELPVAPEEVQTAEITTRDIDRGGYSHFLLKEISEAPASFRKTLRGKILPDDRGRLRVELGEETIPAPLRARLAKGAIRRVQVIGQGTAAVAGQSVASALETCLARAPSPISVTALPATELSGFALSDDMSDTLVIAISQSGTTTDTNRTVDLVRGRGAAVLGIVNRRNSDLVEKVDGVLYTSDGRDVEMSVASTKAFYAQVAAGFLLAGALSEAMGCGDARRNHELLSSLRALPEAMENVLTSRDDIASAASSLAPGRRYWAVVGNGPNRIAASEIRIKLSELCYKSIACDATEDKKHIDLSAEPLILVCAAGMSGPTASDVAKEVAIYRAHKAAPVVIATEGQAERFPAAVHTLTVPAVDPALAFVLSAMAGHLFGYEAALSIDAQARPLREARAVIEAALSRDGASGDGSVAADQVLEALRPGLVQATAPFFVGLRDGMYNGHLEAATAVRLVSMLRYATGALPIEGYELEYGKVGTPAALVEDLVAALTRGIEELTRPVDAIKHQAKTVTVGISRSEDELLGVGLVQELHKAGAPQDQLSYRALRTLAALDPAVEEVLGHTRYRIEGNVDTPGQATIHVVDRGGIARSIPSRTDQTPSLRGTKRRAAEEREVTVGRGRADGRTFILVPEVKGNEIVGMTLLHVRFRPLLPAEVAREVLSGYRNRYNALYDAVTETDPVFDDARLGTIPFDELLTEPVYVLADRWRHPAT